MSKKKVKFRFIFKIYNNIQDEDSPDGGLFEEIEQT